MNKTFTYHKSKNVYYLARNNPGSETCWLLEAINTNLDNQGGYTETLSIRDAIYFISLKAAARFLIKHKSNILFGHKWRVLSITGFSDFEEVINHLTIEIDFETTKQEILGMKTEELNELAKTMLEWEIYNNLCEEGKRPTKTPLLTISDAWHIDIENEAKKEKQERFLTKKQEK